MDDNVTLALAAVRAGAKAGVPVLLSSSAAVYGNQTGVLDETCPLAPLNAYGQAKARMEREAQALAQNLGARVTSLRIGNIAGVDAILGGWRAGFALDRFADGATPRRSYIGAVTLARVLGDLARCSVGGRDLPDVLNVAAPGMIEMGALLDAAGWAGPRAMRHKPPFPLSACRQNGWKPSQDLTGMTARLRPWWPNGAAWRPPCFDIIVLI